MTARRNLAIAFLQKQAQTLIAVVSVMILARLIPPEETGVFSIGVAVAAVTHAVRDFGVGNFLIKEPVITAEKIRTAFTISLLIAAVLSAVLLGIAGPTARFYGQPEVATVVRLTTFGLLISPLSTVNLALLLRERRFFDMFKVSMAGAIAGAAVSVFFAWRGQGATALALGSLATSLATVVAANLLLPRYGDYLPSLAHWRPIWRFGVHSTLAGVSDQIGGRASDLILGKMLGFGPVGILSRSGSLITMFQDAVLSATAPVVLASMAVDARKGDGASAKVLISIEYATVVAWPFFAVLAIFAHDAVLVLFGRQWLAAAPYTSILCGAAALSMLPSFSAIAATATGRMDLLSRYSMANQGIRVGLIALGALSGLRAVALLLVMAAAIQCGLAYMLLRRAAPITAAQVVQRVWRSLAVTAIVAAAMVPVDLWAGDVPLIRMLVVAVTATVAWLAGMAVVRHPAAGLLAAATALIASRLTALMPPKFRLRGAR